MLRLNPKMRFLFWPFLLLSCTFAFAQNSDAGRNQFESHCVGCHGTGGNGGELGPAIVGRVPNFTDAELDTLIHTGLPNSGMPANLLNEQDTRALVAYLRSLKPADEAGPRRATVTLTDRRTLEGLVLNQTAQDMQLLTNDQLTNDQRVHLLRKNGAVYREVTSQTDWPTYNGKVTGSRNSSLTQINKSNVARVAPKWIFSLPNTAPLEGTPVVVEGMMYMTSANECYALDAGTGRQIWHYQRRRTRGLIGNAAGGINRGVAIAGDRLFMDTDNAHVIALNRFTGKLLWDTEMADWRVNYNATSAPLVVGNLVVTGVSGGDEGARGFIAAYKASTGEPVWRFWAMPARGEPLSETWVGSAIEHGCSATWMTGTYDPESKLLYWTTGNPCPDYNGDERKGDNLYSSSVLALESGTGKLRWYYQYTPHDLHDWDAQQTPMLIDAPFNGRPRKLLAQANRNGFFYVLDRVSGELLLAKPFVEKMNWATGIGPDGRPQLLEGAIPTAAGVKACPAVEGATNWMSTAYNPATGLFYVMALEKCNIYVKQAETWQQGKSFYGGTTRRVPGEQGKKYLRALDPGTGKTVWELPQEGRAQSWGGVLSTAGGVVFFGHDDGSFAAADARTGKQLWSFPTNHTWKASPMTYMVEGKQYVAVAAAGSVVAFGLP